MSHNNRFSLCKISRIFVTVNRNFVFSLFTGMILKCGSMEMCPRHHVIPALQRTYFIIYVSTRPIN